VTNCIIKDECVIEVATGPIPVAQGPIEVEIPKKDPIISITNIMIPEPSNEL
jgi:hypothetical protein